MELLAWRSLSGERKQAICRVGGCISWTHIRVLVSVGLNTGHVLLLKAPVCDIHRSDIDGVVFDTTEADLDGFTKSV
jgi:hypothetical protein